VQLHIIFNKPGRGCGEFWVCVG